MNESLPIRTACIVIDIDPDRIQEATKRVQQFLAEQEKDNSPQERLYLSVSLAIDSSAEKVQEVFRQDSGEYHEFQQEGK